uniref:Integral membrane protein 2 n=1 Tax=Gouania willdenowi TaxID=441366 RepID=A0A8C5HB21_GOUWI
MVKITFAPVSTQKADKEREADTVVIAEAHEHMVCPVVSNKSFPTCVVCLSVGLLLFLSGLVLTCVFTYRHFYVPQQIPEDSLFHCRVFYEDAIYAPLRGRQELEEKVGIFLEDNYEQISVPVPHFGGSDPADIIHDFQRGLTAYHDLVLDKCYITELNSTSVMAPRSLWELLVNVKVNARLNATVKLNVEAASHAVCVCVCVCPQRGTYLPHTYIVQEEMVVTGRVRNTRQLGPFIHRLCYGKDTYRLRHRSSQRQRIKKRETRRCHRIRHFENTFVVETLICELI